MPSAAPAKLLSLFLGAALLAGCGDSDSPDATGSTPTAPPAVLTAEDDGATFVLRVGESTSLRLASDWSWEQPVVDGDAVALVPVDYEADPGFVEWLVEAAKAGSADVAATGEPSCAEASDCPARTVRLRFEVSGGR